MSRNKKGSNKAKAAKAKVNSKANSTPKRVPSGAAKTPPSKNGDASFTLRDAGRNSEHSRSFWEPANALRYKGISFVSGGTTGATLEIPTKEEVEEANEEGSDRGNDDENDDKDDDEVMFEIDTVGDAALRPTAPKSPAPFNPAAMEFRPTQRNTSNNQKAEAKVSNTNGTTSTKRKSTSPSPTRSPILEANKRCRSPVQRQHAPSPAHALSAVNRESPIKHSSRAASPTPSNSSDEVVVFRGRNQPTRPQKDAKAVGIPSKNNPETGVASSETPVWNAQQRTAPSQQQPSSQPKYEVTFRQTAPTDDIDKRQIVSESVTKHDRYQKPTHGRNTAAHQPFDVLDDDQIDAEETIAALLQDDFPSNVEAGTKNKRRTRRNKRQRQRDNRRLRSDVLGTGANVPDDVLDDYLQNMRANGEIEDADRDDEWEDEPDQSEQNSTPPQATPAHDSGWGRAELEDLADLPTSEEVCEVVSHVLSRRERASGLQYLVVWEGHSVDEARWIHHEALLERHRANVLIADFEEKQQIQIWNEAKAAETGEEASSTDAKAEKVIVGPGESSIEEEEEDRYDEEDDSEGIDDSDADEDEYDTDDLPYSDEEDLIQRRKERMSDEHIARLLQRQEELGMGFDELVLFDGYEEKSGDDDDLYAKQPRRSARLKNGSAKSRNRPDIDPLDEAVNGDDYGNFDVMDWNRPSIAGSKKSKQARDIENLQLSDSDLERQLRDSWAADKQKKKAKKIEREEMRAESLLGGNGKKANKFGSTKRADGLNMNEFEDELEEFLSSKKQQLALPPMDKKLRKFVHEVANRFGLKSKSSGSGNNRFPILIKTARTKRFDAATFDILENRLSKRFGLLGGGSARGKAPKAFMGKGNLSLADGQVVGAGAKEIGVENKGRAMLEKMGWNKGTALGALDNKGILMPISSVMKKTRAGLG